MPVEDNIKQKVRNFILEEFASDGEDISDDYPLMANGLLDSIGSLRVVSFAEAEFNIIFEPYEITADNLGSINALTKFILMKSDNGKE